MTSTAITAQGATLKVNSSTSGAKTITAAAVGNPTIFTSNAHGLNNGDVVTLAALVGTISAMNGLQAVVTNKTANTFAVNYDSTGLAYTSGGTATPVTWTKVSNVRSFTAFDGSAADIDVSNFDSTSKEFLIGLRDNGTFAAEVDYDQGDAGQLACIAAQASQAKKQFQLTLPDTHVATFNGYVKKAGLNAGVDASNKRPIEIRITGDVTWT